MLFVFAINIAGEENHLLQAMIPKPLAYGAVVLAVFIAGWLTLPPFSVNLPASPMVNLAASLYRNRAVDAILQVILIFAGVLGVLGLLAEERTQASLDKKNMTLSLPIIAILVVFFLLAVGLNALLVVSNLAKVVVALHILGKGVVLPL